MSKIGFSLIELPSTMPSTTNSHETRALSTMIALAVASRHAYPDFLEQHLTPFLWFNRRRRVNSTFANEQNFQDGGGLAWDVPEVSTLVLLFNPSWLVYGLDNDRPRWPPRVRVDVFAETFIGTYQRVSISICSRLKVVDSLSRIFMFLKRIY